LAYAKSKPGVWFARKDEIAKWAVEHRSITPIYDRGAPTVSGLPGSEALSSRHLAVHDRCPVSVVRLSTLMHLRLYGDEHPALLANQLRVCRLR
jgi:hypothetical protein